MSLTFRTSVKRVISNRGYKSQFISFISFKMDVIGSGDGYRSGMFRSRGEGLCARIGRDTQSRGVLFFGCLYFVHNPHTK